MYFLISWLTLCGINLVNGVAVIDICNVSKNTIYAAIGSNTIISTWEVHPRIGNLSKCAVEITACPACIVYAKIWLLELTKKYQNDNNLKEEKLCGDDRLEITEPTHRVHSRKQFCYHKNQNRTVSKFIYRSQTRGIKIAFYYSNYYAHPFTIECTAKHNIRNFEIPYNVTAFERTITSPFFPIHYPLDYRAQYNIKCSPRIVESCRIKITFLDYQLVSQSLLEFFEGGNKRLSITTGRVFRPPIIVSDGRILSINFYANRASSFGFKFNYTAVLGEQDSLSIKPETSCGGYIKDFGGVIVMSKMTEEFYPVSYDCIWIIKPQHEHKYLKTNLYVKVVTFHNMEKESKLEIHKGLTSSHRKLQYVDPRDEVQNSTIDFRNEHVESISTGFYIHLHGIFNSKSRLAISYSAFSFSHFHEINNTSAIEISAMTQDCYITSDFLCHNQRCIAAHLHCDGFDHCGDDSDELYQCARGEENEDHWYPSNYYFPQTESFSSIPTGFLISFCTVFMIFVLCSLMCTLGYRMQHHTELNNTMGTLHQMMTEQRLRDRNDSNEGISREPPPQYEFPPNYNEIMEMEILLQNDMKNAMNMTLISNESKASCSHSYYTSHTGKLFSQQSSSDEDSFKSNEMLFKKYAVFGHSHSEIENLVHSTILNDSTAITKTSKADNYSKKKKSGQGKIAKNKFGILLSKSTSNLISENLNQQNQNRLSRSVDGIPYGFKLNR